MNGWSAQIRMLVVVMGIGAMGACKGKDTLKPEEIKAVTAKDQYAIDSARMELDRVSAAVPTELGGSRWDLVQLRTTDDSVLRPERHVPYTLEFGSDGQAIVVGGCNRGGGTYTVHPPKDLSFGPLATTRAMCAPGSISARYLGDFARMRSYQLVGGRLFISLADGGAVYEFTPQAPAEPAAVDATVIFACSDSTGAKSRIIATFTGGNTGKAFLGWGRSRAEVPRVRSGSGARYEGSGVMFWNKGREAMVSWHGTSLQCMATQE
jgi:heat shock protein HslJ